MDNLKSNRLSNESRCAFRRSREIKLGTGTRYEGVFEKAKTIKQTIKDIIWGKTAYSAEELVKMLNEKFQEIGYPTEESRRLHAVDAAAQIIRYVSSEHRSPLPSGPMTVYPFGLCAVDVNFDFLFMGEKEYERTMFVGKKKVKYTSMEPYVEIVKLCCRKPDVTVSGKKKDTGARQNLELYAMLLVARAYAQKLSTSPNLNIEASFYFLRKNTDSSESGTFDTDFFHGKGAGNIVALGEKIGDPDLDGIFRPQFASFLAGEEVCGEACKKCDFYTSCNFTKPPVIIKKERKQKCLRDLRLTNEQEAAIGFRKGIARINAGAGAGKTLVVALRTAFMLDEGVPPEKICLLTFTNAAAEEMRERVKLYTEDLGCNVDISKLVSTTFNAFGNEIVKKNYQELGYAHEPTLIDDIQRASIIAELLDKTTVDGLDYKNFKSRMPSCKGALYIATRVFDIIKRERAGSYSEEMEKMILEGIGNDAGFIKATAALETLFGLYLEYDEILHNKCLIEYADQELLIFDILRKNPFYFEDYGFWHVVVDEFQDSNAVQFEILQKLIDTPDFESFMIVGDDSQAIYGFRDSTPEYIIHFFEKLKKTGEDFYLLENYRSTPEIIGFANALNARNEHRVAKDLIAMRGHGEPVTVKCFWDAKAEMAYAVGAIKQEHAKGHSYEEIAYIAATRNELLKMGTMLTEEKIPWVMLNPEPMMENSRVDAALAYFRYFGDLTATRDAFTYLNAAEKGILLQKHTDTEVNDMLIKFRDHIASMQTMPEEGIHSLNKMVLSDLEAINEADEVYEAFLEKFRGCRSVKEMETYARAFQDYGETEAKKREKDYPGVVLTTAHSSKGLEWPVVINAISNYHSRNLRAGNTRGDDVEEKRRLLFVSATRARDKLYITGQMVAYGSKKSEEEDNRVFNIFLKESCEITGTEYDPVSPKEKEKELEKMKKQSRKAG